MILYTIQMSRWRLAQKLNIPFLDITRKSGEVIFAPTWEMVLGHKDRTVSDAEYTQRYEELMLRMFNLYRAEWETFLQREQVAVACFCTPGHFCHRHLFKDIIRRIHAKRGWEFIDGGELLNETSALRRQTELGMLIPA